MYIYIYIRINVDNCKSVCPGNTQQCLHVAPFIPVQDPGIIRNHKESKGIQGTADLQQLRWDQFRCSQRQWMLWAFDAAAGRTHLPTPLTELPEMARIYDET